MHNKTLLHPRSGLNYSSLPPPLAPLILDSRGAVACDWCATKKASVEASAETGALPQRVEPSRWFGDVVSNLGEAPVPLSDIIIRGGRGVLSVTPNVFAVSSLK